MKNFWADNKGQGGITNLFVFWIIYLALSVAFLTVAVEIIQNSIAPAINGQPFDDVTLLLYRIAAYVLWAVIPIAVTGAALRGQEVQI